MITYAAGVLICQVAGNHAFPQYYKQKAKLEFSSFYVPDLPVAYNDI